VKYIFDACALIALFDGEEGYDTISDLILSPRVGPSIHSVNMIEVFYHFARQNTDDALANSVLNDLLSVGIEIFDETYPKIWKEAAHLKTRYRPLSLADAIGVAYAKTIRGIFVTADHAELDPLARDGVCKFFFFR
jgi:PIN domain nuclease of toxin-antitoxin system